MGEPFSINNKQLRDINEAREVDKLSEFGGVEKIVESLKTNLETGLEDDQSGISTRKSFFGANVLQEPPSKSFISLLLNSLREPILILLGICAVIEIILGATVDESPTGWVDGLAILIAVLLVSNVTAGTDYDKEKKFRALNSVKNDRRVKVLRKGKQEVTSITEIVVGDVVILDTGDWVPADGLYIGGNSLSVDESSMTGEPDAIKKNPKTKPFLLSGTQAAEGNGRMLVTAVGMNSEWGITYAKLIVPPEETPLQESLGDLAKKIGYAGTAVAVLVFFVLAIQFIVEKADDWKWSYMQSFLQFFTLAITIVVVAVPEGLPLAVTISLAYSMKAMLKDNNLVRHLAACETMGGATMICSDKTGTLTENRMTVTNGWFCGQYFTENLETELPSKLAKEFIRNFVVSMSVNSAAFVTYPKDETAKIQFVGSKTECAMLVLTDKLGFDYNTIRKEEKALYSFPFSSEKKRSSVIIRTQNGARLHVKGASEIILGLCDHYLDEKNSPAALGKDKVDELKKIIETMASEGLRTLCIAYKDIKEPTEEITSYPDDSLTLIGIVGIKDPLRPEVPDAIRQCKLAGITVRMVTGDNKLTASKIAADCGILAEGQDVMEGPDFRKLTDDELDAALPNLRVLARSSPSDKHRLVTRLKHLREVVAVTGDGTNDGPALKAADVGFGMGIAGTEIAKEAADIIIMDDNFASIVKAVMWGRCVRGNIQKFLQFQLTVNLVALTIALVAAAAGYGEPLKPIQFLWVNLIQDTLAALALATEKPTPDLLHNPPSGRNERLITPLMWRNMVCVAVYQIAILFMILFAGDKVWNLDENIDRKSETRQASVQYTMLFNTFVFFQLFNEINCRLLNDDWNPFRGFFTNWLFVAIVVFCAIAQAIFIEFGGEALATKHLNAGQWFSCLGLGASVLIVGTLVRVIVPPPTWPWLKYNNVPLFGRKYVEEKDEEMRSVEPKTEKA